MSKEIYISSTPHETRLAIVESDELTEIYYERENEYTLAGSIYNGKVTRVLPGMQSSFVDIGLDRDAFLYITDFMEEAGEAADFEGNANGSEPRRIPREGAPREVGRSNRRRDSEARNEHAPRELQSLRENQARPPAEPSDSELFKEAVSGLDPSRPATEAEGGDRSRRGGRNRRDRNLNSDGTTRRDRQDRPDRSSDRGPRVDISRAEPPALESSGPPAPILSTPPSVEDGADLGEGAPVADGSRRWRGRRGRRGSRPGDPIHSESSRPTSDRQDEAADHGAQPLTPPADLEPTRPAASTGPVANAYPEPFAEASVDAFKASPAPGSSRRERSPRAPRGFAPSTGLYKVEGTAGSYAESDFEEAPAEPIILPGESLSKYRPAGPQFKVPEPVQAPPASTEFILPSGWDGGLVLPGETIRPRGPRPDSSSAKLRSTPQTSFVASPSRGDRGDRGGRERNRPNRNDDRGGPEARSDREASPARSLDAQDEAILGAASEQHSHPSSPASHEAIHPNQMLAHVNTTFVPPPPMPTGVLPDPDSFKPTDVLTQQDYEPTEASASFRVDAAPLSEFRHSAPVLEAELIGENTSEVPSGASVQSEAQPELEHHLTVISDSGDMLSEPFELTTQDLVAQSASAQGAPQSTEPVAADVTAADQTLPAPYFAPGDGFLEEEVLEDEVMEEDPSVDTIQGSSSDFHEHEAFEGAPDLGSMIRDMSIDQITRSQPTLDDNGEDEDFFEEDQDFTSEDSNSPERLDDDSHAYTDDPQEALSSKLASPDDSHMGDQAAHELAESPYGSDPAAGKPSLEQVSRMNVPVRREESRRDNRRDDRRPERNRRPSGERDGSSNDRDRSSSDRGRRDGSHRQSAQSTNLPAISELLKPGQEILCQIAKEPIAKKGARITSHIALPGRFLVFMPTVHHTGVSRKIESDAERRRLKEILLSEKGEAAGGFIVRTAAAGASEEELRSDLRFLLNLWTDIKTRSESSKSPALIYHDLNLVERVLRDQVTDTFSAIWVDTETEYERVLRFLQRFQPSLIRRVKLYTKETPLFEQFGITEEINKALRSKVWLKSGGSIVINQTEALVAIDINTGKFVGKTARLEDTIVKTNLDAIPEIVRQIRLRDLGGIIIIDFIDMDDRKNRNKVMAALEDELKTDRAPSKVLPFNDFGLVAITRKRVKQSLERTLSSTCAICQGTGMTKSPVSVCNDIYIEMRKMQKHLDRGDVMLRVHPEVVKQLKSVPSRWLQEMEEMVGKTILVKSDPSLHPEQFDIH